MGQSSWFCCSWCSWSKMNNPVECSCLPFCIPLANVVTTITVFWAFYTCTGTKCMYFTVCTWVSLFKLPSTRPNSKPHGSQDPSPKLKAASIQQWRQFCGLLWDAQGCLKLLVLSRHDHSALENLFPCIFLYKQVEQPLDRLTENFCTPFKSNLNIQNPDRLRKAQFCPQHMQWQDVGCPKVPPKQLSCNSCAHSLALLEVHWPAKVGGHASSPFLPVHRLCFLYCNQQLLSLHFCTWNYKLLLLAPQR